MPTFKKRIKSGKKLKPSLILKSKEIEKPTDAEKVKYGRKLYIKDSWGNFVKDPILENADKGAKPWEVEPDIKKKILTEIKKQKQKEAKGSVEKFAALSTESLTALSVESSSEATLSEENIKLETAHYTPNPFPRFLGGDCRFRFRVYFENSLPDDYDTNISLFLDGDLKVSKTMTFNTNDFTWNSSTERYETEYFSEVRVPASSFNDAYSGQTLGSVLRVYYTVMDAISSMTTGICSGVQDLPCTDEKITCNCCEDCECEEKIIPCEGVIQEGKKCRDEPECQPGGCSGGSCQRGTGNVNTLHKLSGNVNSNVSITEGKLRMLATQLRDGNQELSFYYSSINVMDPAFYGWYMNFNEHLLEDSVDKSILARINPKILQTRFVYNQQTGYSPYNENSKATLAMDEVTGTAVLTYEDGSSSVYEIPEFHPNIPTIYCLIGKYDSNGKLLVKYENWVNNNWPLKITDDKGRVLTGEWVRQGDYDFITYTDWIGRKYQYAFNLVRRIDFYFDPDGNVLEFEYQPSEEASFIGPKKIIYNDETKVEYDGVFTDRTRLASIDYPDGPIITYDYDFENGEITETYDDEKFNEYVFDSVSSVTSRGNSEYPVVKLVSKTDTEGKTSTNIYDENGNLTSITTYKCGVGTEEYTYDERGNILTYTDALDNTTTYEYNDPNNPDKATKIIGPAPFNYETTFTYDADEGWMLTMTDSLRRTTSYTYYTEGVKKGKKKTVTDSLNRTTEYDYDDWGYTKWIKDHLDRYSYFWYDQDGNLQKQTDIYDRTTVYYRDENGNPVMIKDYEGEYTRFEYDSLARLSKMTAPDGTVIRYSYDSNGNTITITDSNGGTTRKEFNEDGKVIREVDAKGYITSYEYDIYGNLIKIIDPMLREKTYEYDAQGRMTKMTDPMGRETLYSCDEYCSVNTVVDPNGWTTKYHNDVKCQVTKIEFNDGSFYQFTYDELGRKTAETGAGNLYGENVYGGVFYGEKDYGSFKYEDKVYYGFDPFNTVYYEYDAGDRLTEIKYPGNADISYEYDLSSRITKITDAGGMELTYVYDDDHDGRISSVTKGNKTVTYTYNDMDKGKLLYITLPNGIKKELITDEETGSLKTIKYSRNDTVLYQLDYERYDNGNISKKIITKPNGTKDVYDYNYDIINRLVSVEKNQQLKTWYDFDPIGNRLKKKMSGLTPQGQVIQETQNYDYDACDELNCCNGIRFRYDMNGNMTEKNDPVDGETDFVFNYQGRLMKIQFPDGTESRYVYKSDGMRLSKKDKWGNITNYHWGASFSTVPEVLDETDADGNIITNYFPYIGFKSTFNNNQWHFYITDHLGSVIALTDENGNITDQYQYDEYGTITKKIGTSHNTRYYTGQELDNDSGLIYLRARYYDPIMGRFIRRDPIGSVGGMNHYVYTVNNPINYKDINGMHHVGVLYCSITSLDKADHITPKTVWNICCMNKNLEEKMGSKVFDKVKHCVVACEFFKCLFKYNIATFNMLSFIEAETYTIGFIHGWEEHGGGGVNAMDRKADIYAGMLGLRNAQLRLYGNCVGDCCKERFYDDKMNLLPFLQ